MVRHSKNQITTNKTTQTLPGWKSAFRAEFWPDCCREITDIGPPAGRRADFDAFPVAVRPKSGPEAPLRNMEYSVY